MTSQDVDPIMAGIDNSTVLTRRDRESLRQLREDQLRDKTETTKAKSRHFGHTDGHPTTK